MKNFLKKHLIEIILGYFGLMVLTCKLLFPPFNLKLYALSDLGVIPQTAMLFNISLLLICIGILLFLRWNLPVSKNRYQRAGTALIIIACLGIAGIGLTPYNINENLHIGFALVASVSILLAMLSYGIGYYVLLERSRGNYSFVIAVITLSGTIGVALMFPGLALAEIFFIIMLIIWYKRVLRV